MNWKKKPLLLLFDLAFWYPVTDCCQFDSNIWVKDATKTSSWNYLYTKNQFLPTCDKTTPPPLPPPCDLYRSSVVRLDLSCGSLLPQEWIPDTNKENNREPEFNLENTTTLMEEYKSWNK
ncbi:hypothetical protein DSO57_1022941 [Entomophthora muscae]|uniref:Uncharacterized protein n=1 Tax=Entomophthora muscae TaxID=34485 RepID=A0ACC2UNK3_9FUNG|nr:hypothetical protein DSO57_1022941 [Entomophthora muscae]